MFPSPGSFGQFSLVPSLASAKPVRLAFPSILNDGGNFTKNPKKFLHLPSPEDSIFIFTFKIEGKRRAASTARVAALAFRPALSPSAVRRKTKGLLIGGTAFSARAP